MQIYLVAEVVGFSVEVVEGVVLSVVVEVDVEIVVVLVEVAKIYILDKV